MLHDRTAQRARLHAALRGCQGRYDYLAGPVAVPWNWQAVGAPGFVYGGPRLNRPPAAGPTASNTAHVWMWHFLTGLRLGSAENGVTFAVLRRLPDRSKTTLTCRRGDRHRLRAIGYSTRTLLLLRDDRASLVVRDAPPRLAPLD